MKPSLAQRLCLPLWLGLICLLLLTAPALAVPNAPTIISIESKTVVGGQTLYLNQTSAITVVGAAEASKTIKIFDGAAQVGTTTSTAGGTYSVDISLAAGSHNLTAKANDVTGDSAASSTAAVLVDVTAPSLGYAWFRNVGWSTLGYPPHRMMRYSTGHIMQADVSDSGGSGLDFTTMTIKLYDLGPWNALYGTPVEVAGNISHDGVGALKFDPITDSQAGVNDHKYQSVTSIRDKAGNLSTANADWFYDVTAPVAPTITKIYDPGHASFTGTGEPSSNLPDAQGYVNYYPNMTISSQPIKIKGRVSSVGVYESEPSSAPVGGAFQAYNVYSMLHDSHWTTCSATTTGLSSHGSGMNLSTGDFVIDYPTGDPNYIFPEGLNSIYVISVDTAFNTNSTYISLNFNSGAPRAPGLPTGFGGGEMRIGASLDFPMSFPTFTGLAQTSGSDQSVCVYHGDFYSFPVYNYTSNYKVCQVVRPTGQFYANTAGAYNSGDAWHDSNNNWLYDAGEVYSDSSGSLTNPSDGRSYRLPNVRSIATPLADHHYIGIGAANLVGESVKQRVARIHYVVSPPQLRSVDLAPTNSTELNLAQKPSSVTVKLQTVGEDWCPGCHGLDTSYSAITLRNNSGTNVSGALSTAWSYTGSELLYFGTLNTSSLTLPEGTYTVRVDSRDMSLNVATDTSYKFKIDNSAPTAVNPVPAGGSSVSSIPSFNADIVDPNLADGTPGTGTNLSSAQNQIDPYRRLGSATATASGSLSVNLVAADAPVGGQAVDHRGTPLPTGAPPAGGLIQIWNTSTNAIAGTANISSNGSNVLNLSLSSGSLAIGTNYTVYYMLPHFDSNNGSQKVAAVPTQPAIVGGLYAARITGLDKVGNSGVTITATSIQMDPPVGTIALTPASSNVYILTPSPGERTTVTSAQIKGQSNTVVPDGTLVTISLSGPGTLVEADANGIAADGHQIATGANGAGAGQIKFTVRANDTTSFGIVTVNMSVGAATGSTTINMLRPVLAMAKSADKTSAKPGELVEYTLTYTNSGNSPAQNVTVTDRLPAEVAFEPGSASLQGSPLSDAAVFNASPAPSGRISYNLGTVANGATVVFKFKVKIR